MASFGEEFKRERELRDISLREIADATNISVRFLEALENNDFAALPGGVYVRGFIRSVAHHVGLDVDETMAAYQQEVERQELLSKPESGRGAPAGASVAVGRIAERAVAGGLAAASILIGAVYWAGSSSTPEVPPPDPAAHGASLRARMQRSGALPPLPYVESHRDDAPVSAENPPAQAFEPGIERLVGIRALETTRVQLTCAGEVRFREDLWVGVERQFACMEPILLSAGNAGAIEYSVDAQALQVLGEPGKSVKDVLILGASPASAPSVSIERGRVQGAATVAGPGGRPIP